MGPSQAKYPRRYVVRVVRPVKRVVRTRRVKVFKIKMKGLKRARVRGRGIDEILANIIIKCINVIQEKSFKLGIKYAIIHILEMLVYYKRAFIFFCLYSFTFGSQRCD